MYGFWRNIKEVTVFSIAALYVLFVSLAGRTSRRVVIYYHGIKKADSGRFKKQMDYLAEKCYVVKPSEIKSANAGKTGVLVSITFDDAFVSVKENAVPILKKNGLPAAIFVPAGNLGQQPNWEIQDDCLDISETVMDEEQISSLAKDGFEIFSHTLSHPVLTEIGDSELKAELIGSKSALEKIVGHAVSVISYPYGACDDRVCLAAKKAGYVLGFTIEPSVVNHAKNDLKIGRFSVSSNDSLAKFKLKVKGGYQILKYLRKPKRAIAT